MSAHLDTRLREIFISTQSEQTPTSITEAIAQIHQTYNDAGYIKPLAKGSLNYIELENASIVNEAAKRAAGIKDD